MGSTGPSSRITSPDIANNSASSYLGIKGPSHSHSQSQTSSSFPNQGYAQRGMARASVDASRPNLSSLNMGGMGAFGAQSTGPASVSRMARPASELLSTYRSPTSPDTDSSDRWFTDLQHYETTLEEMAAASLDQNFKEELTAIEQWFRVLSESERTAALYSLLQSSTQMQIRFFITVLQQMARSDPFGAALLSPTNPTSMEAQMEQRLAQLNLKPSNNRQFGRASMGVEPTNFLSPNAALLDPNDSAAAALAAQRARIAAHRISAPGTLLGAHDGLRSPIWQDADRRSPSPVGEGRSRPKSTGSDVSNHGQIAMRHSLMGDEAGLSPMPAGSWASMVNTPLVPMFQKSTATDDENHYGNGPTSPTESTMAASRLGWGSASTSAAPSSTSGIVLDDARKFRRTGRMPSSSGGLGALPPMGQMGAMGALGGSSSGAAGSVGGVSFDASGNFMVPSGGAGPQAGRRAVSGPASGPQRIQSPNSQSSLLASQQQAAALAAQQNWRANANGLLSSGNLSAGPTQTTFGNAQMASLTSSNSAAPNFAAMTPQELATYNMTSLLLQQQQQQLQLQQNLMNLGMANNLNISPNLLSANANQMALAMNNAALLNSAVGSAAARRSPRTSDRGLQNNKPPPVPGSGANPDEQVDDSLLSDVSSWLRSLRLHKYTTNFEGVKWQEMVRMNDAALEAKGVTALGARRKLLKVFEVVRTQKGIDAPSGLIRPEELTRALSPGASSAADSSIGGD